MRSNLNRLYIKKRPASVWLCYTLLLLPLFFSFFFELLGLPGIIKFVVDAAVMLLLFRLFYVNKFTLDNRVLNLFVLVILYFIYCSVSYMFNFESIFYLLWGIRNIFRFYVAFFAFVVLFDRSESEKFLKLLDIIFYINFAVTIIQYIMGYKQDYLGGIFGVQKGCNAATTIFLGIVVTKSLLQFMNKKEKAWISFLKCVIALLISALAELKFFFVYFIIILVMAALLTAFSWKKLLLLATSFLLIFFMSNLLVRIFDNFENFLSIENIFKVATQKHYASSNDMNRFSAIPTIMQNFLKDIPSQLFGKGLGNCDTSTIAIFNTEFYNTYVDTHYSIFLVSFLFMETGYIGLMFYGSFFIMCLIYSIKNLKQKNGVLLYNQIGVITAILAFVLMFYNASLRSEIAYMFYLCLALPFIGKSQAA